MTPTALQNEGRLAALIPYSGLFFAVFAGSSAAVMIRLAQAVDIPTLLIVAARLGIASLVLLFIAVRRNRGELRGLSRQHLVLMLVAGFWLALHFIGFVSALAYTSVLVSQVLVMSSPLWTAALEALFLRNRPHRLTLIGMVVAIIGGVLIALGGSGSEAGERPLLGAAMAAGGALAIAIYLLIGRRVRPHLSLAPYAGIVYGIAALFAAAMMPFAGTEVTGYSVEGYFWVLMIALVPQLLGHSGMNFALRYFSATYVSIVTQLIVVFATIAAFIFFGEVPRLAQIAGSAVLLAGVILASIGQSRRAAEQRAAEPASA